MAYKNAQGFTIYGRDKNENTIWVPFPKEAIKELCLVRVRRTEFSNGNIVWDVTYHKAPKLDYKEYMRDHIIDFTLGEKDVNMLEKIRELKEKLQALMSEAKDFIKCL